MTKKAAKKSTTTKNNTEKLLIENFVGLQKAMTNLSIKFGELSDNITKLLTVFEDAAKHLSEEEGTQGKEIAQKIDTLMEQNQTIAQGLVHLEEQGRTTPTTQRMQQPQNMPPQQMNQQPPQGMMQRRPRPLPRM